MRKSSHPGTRGPHPSRQFSNDTDAISRLSTGVFSILSVNVSISHGRSATSNEAAESRCATSW